MRSEDNVSRETLRKENMKEKINIKENAHLFTEGDWDIVTQLPTTCQWVDGCNQPRTHIVSNQHCLDWVATCDHCAETVV